MMITLKQLQKSIEEYLVTNPDAKDYPVYTFDYLSSEANEVEEIKGYVFLGEDAHQDQFIFDTAEEAIEWQDSANMSIKKIIVL